MTVETRKAIIGLIVAAGLFYLVLYVFKKNDEPEGPKQIPITDENIDVATEAFQAAVINGEPQETLDEMNKTFLSEYGVSISRRADDGRLLVKNMAGNNIKII